MVSDSRQAQFTIVRIFGHTAPCMLKQSQESSVAAILRGECAEDIEDHPRRDSRLEEFDLRGLLLAHSQSSAERLGFLQTVDARVDQVQQPQEPLCT